MSRPEKSPVLKQVEFVAGAAHPDQLPPPVGVEVAFAGRSNVGKSSLLNSMLGRRNLVRVSSTPGCTRQINFFQINAVAGWQLSFVDLPGYGYAKRSKSERAEWANLIEGYLLERPTLKLVVILVDVRRGVEADDQELIELLASPARVSRPPLNVLCAATKLDKLSAGQRKPVLAALQRSLKLRCIGFSAVSHQGRDELWTAILRQTGLSTRASSEPQAASGD